MIKSYFCGPSEFLSVSLQALIDKSKWTRKKGRGRENDFEMPMLLF